MRAYERSKGGSTRTQVRGDIRRQFRQMKRRKGKRRWRTQQVKKQEEWKSHRQKVKDRLAARHKKFAIGGTWNTKGVGGKIREVGSRAQGGSNVLTTRC